MSNRITLEAFEAMTAEEASRVDLEQLELLSIEIEEMADRAKSAKSKLIAAIDRAHGPFDLGTQRIAAGAFEVKVEVPKTVSWDQSGLEAAIATIRDQWEEDPAEYVTVETKTAIKVSEAAYKAWPTLIRKLFEPHRTVKAGTPKMTIEPKKEAA
jgi:hypothetical protein